MYAALPRKTTKSKTQKSRRFLPPINTITHPNFSTESMEAERKRKRENHRLESRSEDEVAVQGGVEVELEKNVAPPPAQPSEEEVDEFFTILRRMRVALKYFERNGKNVNGNCATVKASDIVTADGIKGGGGHREVVSENCDLDLNAFPATET